MIEIDYLNRMFDEFDDVSPKKKTKTERRNNNFTLLDKERVFSWVWSQFWFFVVMRL